MAMGSTPQGLFTVSPQKRKVGGANVFADSGFAKAKATRMGYLQRLVRASLPEQRQEEPRFSVSSPPPLEVSNSAGGSGIAPFGSAIAVVEAAHITPPQINAGAAVVTCPQNVDDREVESPPGFSEIEDHGNFDHEPLPFILVGENSLRWAPHQKTKPAKPIRLGLCGLGSAFKSLAISDSK